MTETKHDKFVRLSKARMDKVAHAVKQLTYLNSHNYEFSEQEAEEIIFQLRKQTDTVAEALGVSVSVPDPGPGPEPYVQVDTSRCLRGAPLELNSEENLHMIHIGPQVGAAINAIEDSQPEEALSILLNLMRS